MGPRRRSCSHDPPGSSNGAPGSKSTYSKGERTGLDGLTGSADCSRVKADEAGSFKPVCGLLQSKSSTMGAGLQGSLGDPRDPTTALGPAWPPQRHSAERDTWQDGDIAVHGDRWWLSLQASGGGTIMEPK